MANCKLRRETGGGSWISLLGVLACAIALSALVLQTMMTAGQAWQVFVLVGMVVISYLIEFVYRAVTGRSILLRHRASKTKSTEEASKTPDSQNQH